ncbi:MAG: hypothetical protein CME64_08525 [Halobacteriovoraceae bacterium]|nr:hypothetical protein [Halobacteriovoraceae bacterium]
MDSTPKHKLIKHAQKLFLEKGLDGASIREIANSAGVNISAISYYFSGKEGLYQACIEDFGLETLSLVEKILAPSSDLIDFEKKLSKFTEHIFGIYTERQELVRLVFKELQRDDKKEPSIIGKSFVQLFKKLVAFFNSAKEQGIVREDLNPFITASLFMSSFFQAVCHDSNRETLFGCSIKDNENFREEYLKHITETFINGISVK